MLVASGSLIGCASFLSSSRNRETVRASQASIIAIFGPQELDSLMVTPAATLAVILLQINEQDLSPEADVIVQLRE